jgi:TolA-binding protein
MEYSIETVAIVALVLLLIGLIAISLKVNSDNQKLEEELQGQTHLANIFSKESQERQQQLTELRMELVSKQKKISQLEELIAELTKIEKTFKEVKEELKTPALTTPTPTEVKVEVPAIPTSRNKRKRK